MTEAESKTNELEKANEQIKTFKEHTEHQQAQIHKRIFRANFGDIFGQDG